MKRIANYLIVLTLAVFAFTSCEDVPSPFGQIVAPKSDDVEVIEPSGKGTLAEPYNVAGVIEYLSGLGADVTSPTDVYIKGVITSITEAFGTQYGNATFEISDTKDAPNKFLCYRVKYFGGQGYSDATALNIKQEDEVIICGKVVNYKGNTPETSANAAYVYSINGKGGGDTPTPTDEVKKVTIAEFNAASESSTQYYQLTGTVKNLKDGDQYGNFDLEDATGSVYVYGLLAEKGGESKKFQELAAAKGIKNGVTLTINGLRSSYNDKIQVKSAYFVSVEAGSGGGGGGTGATGSGTLADPYNAAGANAYISSLAADTESSNDIYIKGKLVKYASNGEFNTQYGNASFYLSDDGTESGEQFYVFRTLYLGNVKYESGETPKAKDEIIICGKVVNYKGNTPETAANKSYIYSLNGKTSAGGGGGGESGAAKGSGTEADPFNVAAAIAKCQQVGETASTEKYYIKGIADAEYTVTSYKNVEVDIVDQAGSSDKFKVFRVKDKDGKGIKEGYKIAKGATIIVYGPVVNYKGNTPETATGAYLVSVNGQAPELDGEGGGGTSGGGATSGDEITVAMNSFGLDNAADLTTLTLSDGTKLTFSQGEGTNGPKYYNSGNAARLYIGNSMTIDAGSKKITKVVINAYADNNASYTAEGKVSGKAGSQTVTPTLNETTFTFSGFSSSTLVVSNNATGTGGSKQLRIVSMTITYAK